MADKERLQAFCRDALLALVECRNFKHDVKPLSVPGLLVPCWNKFEQLTQIFAILEQLLVNLETGQSVSLRGLYYKYAHIFQNQAQCNRLLNLVLKCAGCHSREAFGIIPSAKGLVAGHICVNSTILHRNELLIDDNLLSMTFNVLSPIVLVIEKDSIFQTVKSNMDIANLTIVTGRGVPDIATRKFLSLLGDQCRFLYLGDYDPFGVSIFLTYRDGPRKIQTATVGAMECRCPELRWLGLRHIDLIKLHDSVWLPLSALDQSVKQNLLNDLDSTRPPSSRKRIRPDDPANDELLRELRSMDKKCELEAMNAEFLCKVYLPSRLKSTHEIFG